MIFIETKLKGAFIIDLDRKTVRRCLRQERWQAYRRAERVDTLLAKYADFLRRRAPQVRYSARILRRIANVRSCRSARSGPLPILRPESWTRTLLVPTPSG